MPWSLRNGREEAEDGTQTVLTEDEVEHEVDGLVGELDAGRAQVQVHVLEGVGDVVAVAVAVAEVGQPRPGGPSGPQRQRCRQYDHGQLLPHNNKNMR